MEEGGSEGCMGWSRGDSKKGTADARREKGSSEGEVEVFGLWSGE
jgi:hypothetical protein